MSTAILISGQLRTFAKCWPTQRWHVLRHFADPHFFITVQDGPEIQLTDDLVHQYGADRVHVDARQDPDLSRFLTPELTAAYHLAPYANAAPAHQLLMQHWYQIACWKHFRQVEKSSVEGRGAKPFDTIIRLRADLWFHSFDDPLRSTHPRERGDGDLLTNLVIHECPYANECFTPGWGEFGGINDRFAIMGPEAAKYYFTVFDAIPELLAAGCPFHPESLVAANLERGNVDLHRTLKTLFSTERLDGTRRWPEFTPHDHYNLLARAA
jgi:hypothetical protein